MATESDAKPETDRSPDDPPATPPPVITHNDEILPEAKEKPADNRVYVTPNAPDRTKPTDLLQIAVNGALAVIGICALCIYWGQLNTMKGQLNEMKGSAGDTHDLAVAAGKQADRTQDLTEQMKRQVDQTQDIADRTLKQATATVNLARAAKSAADTARDALVIGNRPWIKVDLWQTAPLEFLPDGSAKIGIQEKIENIGSSVALRVESWFNIFPLGSASDTFLTTKARQKEGCDAIRLPKSTILEGEEMFPHDPMLYSYAETISKDQIVPIKDNAPGMEGRVGQVGFILAGCVTYRSSFEDPTVPSHETLFEYWIAKPAERGGVIPFLDPVGTHSDYSIFRLQNGLTAN